MPEAIKSKDQTQKILDRISRIEGQLRGIRRMIEQKKECINIITQITAIREAVTMLGIELLKDDFICQEKDKEKSEKFLKTLFKLK